MKDMDLSVGFGKMKDMDLGVGFEKIAPCKRGSNDPLLA